VKKMNDLLAKLAGASGGTAGAPKPLLLRPLLETVAEAKRRQHAVEAGGDPSIAALADWARLEQALAHLVQNAIEATEGDAPVRISCTRAGAEALIEVTDSGAGMSPDFVRSRLFQPFASTKPAGFGIGAFEARTLVAAMGGRLEVDSREGAGTRFTIHLPAAGAAAEPQRISA
jgi:signal transduction histidine kinase